jgi:general secretion pathway protein A
MSLEIYGLREDPFGPLSPRHIYLGVVHRKALAALHYGVEFGTRLQLLLAYGGLGKTTLLRYLYERVRTATPVLWVSSTNASEVEVLRKWIGNLSDASAAGVITLHRSPNGSDTSAANDDNPRLILIDAAERLENADLESILSLARLETPARPKVHIILAGRPELLEMVGDSNPSGVTLEQVWLTSLDAAETAEYISQRLQLVGCREPLFTPAAAALIATQSRGVPQRINDICRAALMRRSEQQLNPVDTSLIDRNVVAPNEADKIVKPVSPRVRFPLDNRAWASIVASWSRSSLGVPLLSFLAIVVVGAAFWSYGKHPRRLVDIGPSEVAYGSKETPLGAGHSVSDEPRQTKPSKPEALKSMPRDKASELAVPGNASSTERANGSSRLVRINPAGVRETPLSEDQLKASASGAPGSTAATSIPTLVTPLRSFASSNLAPTALQPSPAVDASVASRGNAISVNPLDMDRVRVQTETGDEELRLGRYDKAIADYKDALLLVPGNQQLEQKIERARRAKATEEQVLGR